MARKTEVQKAMDDFHRKAKKQRAYILGELRKGTRVKDICAALGGLSHQRIYKVKSELIQSGELKP